MSNGINWPAQRERGGSLDETRRNFELEKRSFLLLAQRAQYVGTFLGTYFLAQRQHYTSLRRPPSQVRRVSAPLISSGHPHQTALFLDV